MKKFYNVIKIILISLGVILGIGLLVLYVINPVLAKQIVDTVVDYVNRPLPIIGVSTLVVVGLVWKIFSNSVFGKKTIEQLKNDYTNQANVLKEEYENQKQKIIEIVTFYQEEIDLILSKVIDMCNASANKKVKVIGEEISKNAIEYKEQIREKFKEIVDSDTEILIKSKEEIVNSIVEIVKKEMVEKYGEEGQKGINC